MVAKQFDSRDSLNPSHESYYPHHAKLKITALTPHDIVIYDQAGEEVLHTFPASGTVARVVTRADERQGFLMDGFVLPIAILDYGAVEGLDDWNGDDPIIVSAMVADALAKQGKTYGVYYPDTGPDSVVRDAEGNILGVRRLAFMGD